MTHTLRDVFDNRLTEFQEEYPFQEQDEAIRSLVVVGELLDLMFGGIEAPLVMTALRAVIAHGHNPEWNWSLLANSKVDQDWRRTWSELDGWESSSTPPFFDELHDLNAFANFGILTVWTFAGREVLEFPVSARVTRDRLEALQDVPGWVESVCVKIDQLERLVPRNERGETSLNEMLLTRNQARARVRFDQGQPITIHDLALLSGVSVKRIQNAVYAKTDEAPVVDKNGLISPEACEPWLAARDYRPSIWKQVAGLYPLGEDWGEDVAFEETQPDATIEDFVFVPVANDGTMFVPALRREGKLHGGGYAIGPKGAERLVGDYRSALDELGRMETPRWRRPNSESGKWGIVTGQSWRRVRMSELAGPAS